MRRMEVTVKKKTVLSYASNWVARNRGGNGHMLEGKTKVDEKDRGDSKQDNSVNYSIVYDDICD